MMIDAPPRPEAARRRALADFLRSRRARIAPEEVGLPHGTRRRTPGLRREEVAQLAGVGVTWYTWLEQGRDIRASEQVLDAIARTLRLDRNESTHLFTLAGVARTMGPECQAISPGLEHMLAKLEPFPAIVQNTRTDILAFNRGYDWLMGVADVPVDERNSILLAFTRPDWRSRIIGWADNMPASVAQFRAAMASHLTEPGWKCLVKRLRAESPEFEVMWNRHEVAAPKNFTKRYRHPEAGLLAFDATYLWLGCRSELRLVTFTPADDETAAKLPAFT
ncbi:helix-turn-helix transcriptional regulator [Amycolatopsis sp. YIM 10]|uniref:helix-turn-helix transcriptional regulator n=1 Tax=Amycolatopsis sp. YIM 10 TaxID=2653857 RepID=UPI0012A9DF74|nr:helix-turn-helix transcriptional regulator [Amycolatopsis sp. YIM 10]QFU85342.1 hypothetical protein YIM_00540 [Amycolatopsis sp. YIM 10]